MKKKLFWSQIMVLRRYKLIGILVKQFVFIFLFNSLFVACQTRKQNSTTLTNPSQPDTGPQNTASDLRVVESPQKPIFVFHYGDIKSTTTGLQKMSISESDHWITQSLQGVTDRNKNSPNPTSEGMAGSGIYLAEDPASSSAFGNTLYIMELTHRQKFGYAFPCCKISLIRSELPGLVYEYSSLFSSSALVVRDISLIQKDKIWYMEVPYSNFPKSESLKNLVTSIKTQGLSDLSVPQFVERNLMLLMEFYSSKLERDDVALSLNRGRINLPPTVRAKQLLRFQPYFKVILEQMEVENDPYCDSSGIKSTQYLKVCVDMHIKAIYALITNKSHSDLTLNYIKYLKKKGALKGEFNSDPFQAIEKLEAEISAESFEEINLRSDLYKRLLLELQKINGLGFGEWK